MGGNWEPRAHSTMQTYDDSPEQRELVSKTPINQILLNEMNPVNEKLAANKQISIDECDE